MPVPSWRTSARTVVAVALAVTVLGTAPTETKGSPGRWIWPVPGPVITHYSNDNSRPYAGGMHRGIDVAAPVGTRVVAARGGEVTYAGPLGSSGLTVAVRTADGYATSYLHLAAISVSRGARAAAGDHVGDVGTSGERSARQPHLHFGVRRADRDHYYVDPLSLLPPLRAAGGAAPVPIPASAPAREDTAPAAVPAGAPARHTRAANQLARHPVAHPAPVAPPRAGPDWGRELGLAGLALLFCAFFGRGLARALRNANGALGERLLDRARTAFRAIGHASVRRPSKATPHAEY